MQSDHLMKKVVVDLFDNLRCMRQHVDSALHGNACSCQIRSVGEDKLTMFMTRSDGCCSDINYAK